MEKKYTIFDFFGQIFFIFGITTTCLSVFVILFGADAKEISSIFALGKKGLTIATLSQYFLMSVLLISIRFLLFTDCVIKGWSILKRTISMFALIVIMIGTFSYIFGWFPVGEFLPWIMFLACFIMCATLSVILSLMKERKENEKLQEALEKMKRGEV